MSDASSNKSTPIAISYERFSGLLPKSIKMPSALFVSGATGLAGNITSMFAGIDLHDPMIMSAGVLCLAANVTQMAARPLGRWVSASEQTVIRSSAVQYGLAAACYISSSLIYHNPTSAGGAGLTGAGLCVLGGTLATLFLPQRFKPAVVGGSLYFAAAASKFIAGAEFHNFYLTAAAGLSAISCVAYGRLSLGKSAALVAKEVFAPAPLFASLTPAVSRKLVLPYRSAVAGLLSTSSSMTLQRFMPKPSLQAVALAL